MLEEPASKGGNHPVLLEIPSSRVEETNFNRKRFHSAWSFAVVNVSNFNQEFDSTPSGSSSTNVEQRREVKNAILSGDIQRNQTFGTPSYKARGGIRSSDSNWHRC